MIYFFFFVDFHLHLQKHEFNLEKKRTGHVFVQSKETQLDNMDNIMLLVL